MDVELRKQSGQQSDPTIPVTVQDFLVGSAPSCHLRVDDPVASGHNCRIITNEAPPQTDEM